MEAPTPNEEIIKKDYILTSNKNNIFKIELYKSNNLIVIHAFYEGNNIIKEEYEKKFNIEELKSIKFLSLFDTIEEIFDEIINIFNKKLKDRKLLEETN